MSGASSVTAEPTPLHPGDVRRFVVDVAQVTAGSLSFGDLIDLADATDIEPEDMQAVLMAKGRRRLKLLVGFAWIIYRRAEPDLTFADVMAGQVEVLGKVDPKRRAPKRAARAGSPE